MTPDFMAEVTDRIESMGLPAALKEAARLQEQAVEAQDGDGPPPTVPSFVRDGVGVLQIAGPMSKNRNSLMSLFGGASMVEARRKLREHEENDDVSVHFLHVHSPGGTVAGTGDFADDIANTTKPVVAFVEDMAASAALWVVTQADDVLASRHAHIGSIGVFTTIIDSSKAQEEKGRRIEVISTGPHKGRFQDQRPTDEQKAQKLAEIEEDMRLFVDAVATGRGISESEVRDMATGEMFSAEQALALGLIDSIATIGQAFEHARNLGQAQSPNDGGSGTDPLVAGTGDTRTLDITLVNTDNTSQIPSVLDNAAAGYADIVLEDANVEEVEDEPQNRMSDEMHALHERLSDLDLSSRTGDDDASESLSTDHPPNADREDQAPRTRMGSRMADDKNTEGDPDGALSAVDEKLDAILDGVEQNRDTLEEQGERLSTMESRLEKVEERGVQDKRDQVADLLASDDDEDVKEQLSELGFSEEQLAFLQERGKSLQQASTLPDLRDIEDLGDAAALAQVDPELAQIAKEPGALEAYAEDVERKERIADELAAMGRTNGGGS